MNKNNKGFTMVELMVVIGTIAILVAIVLVAVNPGRQFANARDTQRRSDLYSITNAVYEYVTENKGIFPTNFPETSTCIGTGASCYDLGSIIVPTYITEIPQDPSTGTAEDTGYDIYQNSEGRIVVRAESEVGTGTIEVVR